MEQEMAALQAKLDEAIDDAVSVVEEFSPRKGYAAANIVLLDFSPKNFPAAKAAMEAAASEIQARINYYPKTSRIALIF